MQVQTKSLAWLVAVDMTLVTVACLIPAVSHLFALPLYMLNPMLALLLVGMALGRDWRNALLLAILMPLLSSLLTGMPVLAPVALVGTEWWIQLCAVLLWGGLFAMIYKSRK